MLQHITLVKSAEQARQSLALISKAFRYFNIRTAQLVRHRSASN
jgi:hypothetical protein